MKTEHEIEALPLPLLAIRVRALVLAIGESVSPAWWETDFMSETGLRFLERLYPRTFFRAAVHAAGRVACDVHDRAVGRVGVYHLFRLPESLETEMHRIPLAADEDFIAQARARLGQSGELMAMLVGLRASVEEQDAILGARRIGSDRDLMTSSAFGRTAAVYHHAFKRGKPSFPYFATERGGMRGRPQP